jgi:tight adherence protein B
VLFVVLLGVFVSTVSLCVVASIFIHRGQFAAAERTRARSSGDSSDTPRVSAATILRDTSASELELLDRLLRGKAITARLARELQRAGSAAKPGMFVLALGIAGMSGALAGSVLGSLAVPLALAGLAGPVLWLKQRQHQRLATFQEQLPEALDMLVGAMRAGYSFQTATKFVGEEIAAPLGTVFLQFYDEQRLGIEMREALVALQERSASPDMKMFVTAVLIHGDAGGNLSEVLSDIGELMRQRAEVHRQVDTLSAQSKVSARILAALPVLAFGAVISMDRTFFQPMLAEPAGRFMLAYATISVILGYIILMRISRVDV